MVCRMEYSKLLIVFDDGKKASIREGLKTHEDDWAFVLDNKHVIPRQRIIRMEKR